MRRAILAATALAALAAAPAYAVPIANGSILSLDGNDTFNATSVTFVNPGNIGSGTGSFAGLSCNGCVTFTSFSTATVLPITGYTATIGAISTALEVDTASFLFTPGTPLSNLDVKGNGVLSLTGFDPTPGVYDLTTQGPTDVKVTFSVTSEALSVPEPGALAVFGIGLLGLGLIHRRRRAT